MILMLLQVYVKRARKDLYGRFISAETRLNSFCGGAISSVLRLHWQVIVARDVGIDGKAPEYGC